MNELKLIKLLCSYNNYITYRDLVDTKSLKECIKELYYITISMFELLDKLKHDINIDELQGFFYAKYPDAAKETYAALFDQLSVLDVSEDVGHEILAAMSRNKVALQLAEKAYSFTQGFASLEELGELSAKLLGSPAEQASGFVAEDLDLDTLLLSAHATTGIRWRLQFLNKSLGSLRKGDFGMLIKRPEAGGTLFAAEAASHALDQVTQPVIWFNSEEANDKVMLRVYQSYFGCTLDQLKANAAQYKQVFLERNRDKFLFFGLDRCNKKDTEAIVREYKPALVIYDQMSKTKGFENDRKDLQLGDIFQWGRELAKEGHAGIAIHQADGTAEGVKWLDMGHVANAKTAIQAELDWILGMGMTHNPDEQSIRYFNISKNKLLQDEDSEPTLRHGRGEVIILPSIMRFKDIINYN